MHKKLIKFFRENLIYFFFIIVFLHTTNFFYNSFSILNRDYEERMIRSYGYCEREAYGFVKKSHEITKATNIRIINFESNLWPGIENIFIDLRQPLNTTYTIYLNLNNLENKLDNFNNIVYRGNKFNFNPSNIIYKYSNCYLVKND